MHTSELATCHTSVTAVHVLTLKLKPSIWVLVHGFRKQLIFSIFVLLPVSYIQILSK
jgi:hypothetical protein